MIISKKQEGKVLIIGKGQFGNALAQGLEFATIKLADDKIYSIGEVEQISARQLFSKNEEQMANVFTDVSFIMYCGMGLVAHSEKLANAMKAAKIKSTLSDEFPLLEFMDWSNLDLTECGASVE